MATAAAGMQQACINNLNIYKIYNFEYDQSSSSYSSSIQAAGMHQASIKNIEKLLKLSMLNMTKAIQQQARIMHAASV